MTSCDIPDSWNKFDESLPADQYYCTGLDLYVIQEPDTATAMALVHSRIRRVIYLVKDELHGALGSTDCLHAIPSLNHRYRVFVYSDTNDSST